MASYPAYSTRRTSPTVNTTPYLSASPHATGDGQFYPPGASRISLDDDDSAQAHSSPYKKPGDVTVDMRAITRTPSPTPSEAEELTKTSLFDWKAMSSWRYWIRREWVLRHFAIALVATILFTVFHTQIVKWLQPAANWMHDLKFGWLIPIGILFVISFPPLFGHEIVAILCGLVWGLWIGFAIVCAGTFLGELGNFYVRGEKLEKTDLRYACLAKVVREGGIKIALIARLSAIPGTVLTTAVFSTCGMSVWTFIIAAILSLPKQFITVYLGVALEQSDNGGSSTRDTIVKDVVVGITVIITFVAMWYIYNLMNKAKPGVIYDRRKARQAKLMGMGSSPYSNSSMLQSTASSEIPLTARGDNFGAAVYQQWDTSGRAVGHSGDPRLYVPEPRRAPRADTGSSIGSAYQMSERGGYQSTPTRSDSGLTNPYPHPYAQAQVSRPPSRRRTPLPPTDCSARVCACTCDLAAVPPNMRPLQTAPAQHPYGAQAMAAPMPNPYAAYAPSPPPNANPYAGYAPSPPPTNPNNPFSPSYGAGSAPSTPTGLTQHQFTGGYPFSTQQVPGTAPLPPTYSSQTFAQQQSIQQQYPQTAAPARGQSQAGPMPPNYSSDLR
ncbi:uncharacterized protein B0H18DRAFT_1016162 [Fomitopsis serialis]|uniref:uncharacterized protein n=1 Tax=Fomitopsis serialis TaxID=139415 RepID=UPI002008D18A|nr:uncharacterized protein B0H18DRAFT_1016162 [Neoantrodia serialis]KAH9922920.1 hypothetical protein B0H18DRAFT_1016162 [Neoantrodia serialis]